MAALSPAIPRLRSPAVCRKGANLIVTEVFTVELMKITDWEMNGYNQYVPILFNSLETGKELRENFQWMKAKVPGSVYTDLRRAGLIPDPYYELNSLQCEWVKDRWWLYRTKVYIDPKFQGRNLRLKFQGLDYKAHISMNGKRLGESEAMFLPFEADVTEIARFSQANDISVLLEHAPEEMGQIGVSSQVKTQKSRFTYKWDFCTRLVHLGLYDDVVLEDFGSVRIEESYVRPVLEEGNWYIRYDFLLHGYGQAQIKAAVSVKSAGACIASDHGNIDICPGRNTFSGKIEIENPKLWYPNGHGDQPVYTFHIQFSDGDIPSDEKEFAVGLRTLSFEKCDGAEQALPYVIVVNGKKIFIKGMNITPLDQIYGGLDNSRYDALIENAKNAGVNLLRVWGGGFIESEYFYRQCTLNGIMVWQDFLQSSSGVCNAPSTDEAFMKKMKEVSEYNVKLKRNHTSLTVWCGGNEMREVPFTSDPPATLEHPNIKLLKSIVEAYDEGRLFLPTTASGPYEFLELSNVGRQHDVHGPWTYTGPETYYELYNKATSMLHSEFGADGMTGYSSLQKFLSPQNIKVFLFKNNDVWKNHGEWWCTYERDSALFGDFSPEDIEAFIACSQYMQAEAIRYAIESERRRMFQSAGSILWQLNEPWPNISCTAVVDYYNVRKPAYFYAKDANRIRKATLRYDKLIWARGEKFTASIHFVSDMAGEKIKLKAAARPFGGEVFWSEDYAFDSADNGSVYVGEIAFDLQAMDTAFCIEMQWNEEPAAIPYAFFMDGGDRTKRRELAECMVKSCQ